MSVLPKSAPLARTRTQTRSAVRWSHALLFTFVALLLFVTGVPYLYGYLHAPEGRVFQGIAFNVADIVQYWSWMRDHHSALFVPNRMTPEPNEPALFNSLWLVLGQVQAWTGWSNAGIYQLLRLVGGAAWLVVLWWFCGLFARTTRGRVTAYAVAALGGGLGWVWVVEKYVSRTSDVRFPLDVYVVEPNGFFALLALPHLLVAAAMILAIFGCFLLAEQRDDDWRLYGIAAVIALALGLSHTYDLIMVYGVLGAYVLLQWARARRILWGRGFGLVAIGALSSPPAAYFTYLTSQNPLWKEVLSQFGNAGIFTPDLLHIPVLLGVPFIVTAVYGAVLLRRARARRAASSSSTLPAANAALCHTDFLWVWAMVGFGLLYIPTDFQIKMLNPYQVPLALLAFGAISEWASRRSLSTRAVQLVLALFVVATLPTNLYLFGWRMLELRRAAAPFYLSRGQTDALAWLDLRSDERAVVFSGLEVGQYIAADTGHRSFLGHWAQTVQFFAKRDTVVAFFDAATTAEARHTMMKRYDVRYVVYGPEERRLGAFNPANDQLFSPVFADSDVAIFEVAR